MAYKQRESVKYNQFQGVNNRKDPQSLELSELVTGENIDITKSFKLKRRKGFSQVYSGTDVHSFWTNKSKDVALFVEGSALKELNQDFTATQLTTGLQVGKKMCFADVEGNYYFSNGVNLGKCIDGTVYDWGIQPPASQPVLAAGAGGLFEGTYQIAITYATDSGEESGAKLAVTIDVAASTGIALSAIPQSSDSRVTKVNIYCSEANGTALFRVGSVANGTTSYLITSVIPLAKLQTQFITPPPAGEIIEYSDGRMFVVSGKTLFWSESYAPDWFRLIYNFIQFSNPPTLVAGVEGGRYVSADGTYWLSGSNPKESEMVKISDAKAVKGTQVLVDASVLGIESVGEGWLWMSDKGVCWGGANGDFKLLTEKDFAPGINATEGAGLYKSIDGLDQYIGSMKNPEANKAGVSDQASATIVRNGITLT